MAPQLLQATVVTAVMASWERLIPRLDRVVCFFGIGIGHLILQSKPVIYLNSCENQVFMEKTHRELQMAEAKNISWTQVTLKTKIIPK